MQSHRGLWKTDTDGGTEGCGRQTQTEAQRAVDSEDRQRQSNRGLWKTDTDGGTEGCGRQTQTEAQRAADWKTDTGCQIIVGAPRATTLLVKGQTVIES